MAAWIEANLEATKLRDRVPSVRNSWIPLILSLPSFGMCKERRGCFRADPPGYRVAAPFRLRGVCQLEIGGDETRSYEGLLSQNQQYV